MYFGVGSVTNSGVVGVDNFFFGWLAVMPQMHDIPYRTAVLRGANYVSANPFTLNQPVPCTSMTGAYKPFGVPSSPGEIVPGNPMANSVMYSANSDGSDLQVVANGLRNPFGIGFCPCGSLYAMDQGYDARGSRPVSNSPDSMWRIEEGDGTVFPITYQAFRSLCPSSRRRGCLRLRPYWRSTLHSPASLCFDWRLTRLPRSLHSLRTPPSAMWARSSLHSSAPGDHRRAEQLPKDSEWSELTSATERSIISWQAETRDQEEKGRSARWM